jgi:methyl-accepting chemotaxis protein
MCFSATATRAAKGFVHPADGSVQETLRSSDGDLGTALLRIADISWSTKLFTISGIYIFVLLSVGVLGGYTIYGQNRATEKTLKMSQSRSDAAGKAQVAILIMGRAQAQLLSADGDQERRNAAIAAIASSSALDESIQRLQGTLIGSPKVAELCQLLQKIGPAKMNVIKAVRMKDDAQARTNVQGMQDDMSRVESLSSDLVEEEGNRLAAAVGDQKKQARFTVDVLGSLIGCGITAGLLVTWFVGRSMSRPLAVLERSVRSLATGDLTVVVPTFGKDEIGRTVSAMANMVHDLHSMVTNIHDDGKSLTTHASGVAVAADQLNDVWAKLHSSVGQIKNDAAMVLSSTTTTLERLNQAANTAQHTSHSASKNCAAVKQTVEGFRLFQEQIECTATTSRELMSKVNAIQSITNTIDDLSQQTRFLALNATIEAARAGEQGRGFAVVAAEVRHLARRCDSATAEISALAKGIVSNVVKTVELLEQTVVQAHDNTSHLLRVAEEIASGSEQSRQMHNIMNGIGQLINEQEQAAEGINGTVSGLYELSEGTKHQTEWLHGLSRDLKVAATGLNRMVARFRLQ